MGHHQYLITVDVGTSSTKTALWDETGSMVAEAACAYSLQRPHPLWAEMEGETWWLAVCTSVRSALDSAGIHNREVVGVGVDAVGWTLLPVDRQANPLAPAMIWLDRRAQEETAWMNGLPAASALVHLAANPIDPAYITPKLIWLKEHHPQVFEAAHQFLAATGFIVARLTGEFTCDLTQAYGYHFFDIRQERWDPQAAGYIGLSLDKMPRLCAPTEVVGVISAQAAAQTGLPAGIPVIAGCLDACAGALGSGVTQPGQTNEQGGQAGGFGISLENVVVEPRLIFSHHVIPGQYLLQAGTVGGGSLGWFRDQLGQAEAVEAALLGQDPFELLSQQAARSEPGSQGLIFLPYMAGERTPLWSSTARGVFFGLTYRTQRADMLRAILEGCAYAVYDNLQIAAEHGVEVTEFLGSGGAAKSPLWCQIKADIYGKPFVVARRADGGEGGHNLGLYALTAYGLGWCEDIGCKVSEQLVKRQVYEPSPANHARYQELFQVYRSLSRNLTQNFAQLDTILSKEQA